VNLTSAAWLFLLLALVARILHFVDLPYSAELVASGMFFVCSVMFIVCLLLGLMSPPDEPTNAHPERR
jgi:uncharacterized membrane protein YtjA (UPF0391 family)